LSLPSIPEVASDDETVDEAEDNGKTAKLAAPEAGISPPCPEKAKGLSEGAHGSLPKEGLCDFSPKAPRAAPEDQTAALGMHKPHLGKNSSMDKQLPGSSTGEEEKLKGSGRPSQPPGSTLDSPVPSPSLSETFPAIHSFPSSPHSHTHHTSTAESQKKATAEGSAGKVENFGKRKPVLQAWVSPSETHPFPAQPSTGTGAAKHR
jgi:Rab11 family-interacting protein 1/2/5